MYPDHADQPCASGDIRARASRSACTLDDATAPGSTSMVHDFTPRRSRDYTKQLALFSAAVPEHCRSGRIARTASSGATRHAAAGRVGARHPPRHELLLLAAGVGERRAGLFTGSGMPMRFAKLDGTMIDVYQAATQMTDESGQTYPLTIDTLLDRALGPEGYYGAFVGEHAHRHGRPRRRRRRSWPRRRRAACRSCRPQQMLDWLDGRNNSSFGTITWDGTHSRFTVTSRRGREHCRRCCRPRRRPAR